MISHTFNPRKIESESAWQDEDGIKIYTISALNTPVDRSAFLPRLVEVKRSRSVDWPSSAAFAIFHDGAASQYLVLAWWGNDNELFTSVSVKTVAGWVEDPLRYSFCLWDLEVFWHERNFYIESVYCANPDMTSYRARRMT
jgi:hypothetical protein